MIGEGGADFPSRTTKLAQQLPKSSLATARKSKAYSVEPLPGRYCSNRLWGTICEAHEGTELEFDGRSHVWGETDLERASAGRLSDHGLSTSARRLWRSPLERTWYFCGAAP